MNAEVRARQAFQRQYGAAPAGMWAAPGRVNLIGEHTDYNGGFVLPFALPHRTVVAASQCPDSSTWTVYSEHTDETVRFGPADRVAGWASYVAGVGWALRDAGHPVPGVRLAVASDVPVGAGLSSSAAIECAVLAALVDLAGLDVPPADHPALAQRAENEYVGMPCGIMDQSVATLARAGCALFLDCRSMAVEHIPFDLAGAGLAVLVVDTRAPHRLVTGEYAARRTACERAASALGVAALREVGVDDLDPALARLADPTQRRRVRHVVTEDQRVLDAVRLLGAGRPREIGPLLTASHASLRDDFEVTVPELDVAVEAALDAGAYGARMTGGGFGGCVLALVEAGAVEPVAAAVARAFAASDFAEPVSFPVTAGRGAHRVR
jgi:galactokinase